MKNKTTMTSKQKAVLHATFRPPGLWPIIGSSLHQNAPDPENPAADQHLLLSTRFPPILMKIVSVIYKRNNGIVGSGWEIKKIRAFFAPDLYLRADLEDHSMITFTEEREKVLLVYILNIEIYCNVFEFFSNSFRSQTCKRRQLLLWGEGPIQSKLAKKFALVYEYIVMYYLLFWWEVNFDSSHRISGRYFFRVSDRAPCFRERTWEKPNFSNCLFDTRYHPSKFVIPNSFSVSFNIDSM